MEGYVSGLTIIFPEGTHKENCGCHRKVQEEVQEEVQEAESKKIKEISTNSLLHMVNIREEDRDSSNFQMPLHYPNYTKEDYEDMPESKLDLLLASYGLSTPHGDLDYKREFAMGAFLWPDPRQQGADVSSPSHALQDSSAPKESQFNVAEFFGRRLLRLFSLKT